MRPRPASAVHVVSTGFARLATALFVLGAALWVAPASRADSLHYFKNYFVTGDYSVAGTSLYGKGVAGTATGTINMNSVPAGADIVAAFLYWQTVEAGPATSKPAAINGTFVSNGANNAIVGDVLGAGPAAACWTPSGSTAPTATAVTRVYRADVLRYLPVISASNIRNANGTFKVLLPDSGASATATPHTYGATLVVVYRMLPVASAFYKSVVIYDGVSTLTRSSSAFSQTIGGFYQALGLVGAKMTQIVGNGQSNFDETLTVNGSVPLGLGNDVFTGAQGPRWDNPTFNINLPLSASSLQTQVLAQGNQVCLSWAAVVTSTIVVNTDGDGILDTWKVNGLHLNVGSVGNSTSNPPVAPVAATFGGCSQFPNDPCENFPKMGAVLGTLLKPHKDVFVQMDWMQGTDNGVYPHIHSPKLAALQMIAGVFASHNISVHFDVGPNYYQQTPALPYIVPKAYAKGGNVIQESTVGCPNAQVTNSVNCSFPNLPYSALGWKVGFDAIANGFQALGLQPVFPHDRKDTFHYVLFGHALASPFPVPNPPVPTSVSGVADTPGGDLLVTLGLWNTTDPPACKEDDPTGLMPLGNLCTNQTGTAIVQAGTVMHELGHNMGLYHGGSVKVPNCMPDYPSVMNYLYQTRGLTDAAGNEHVDFSFGQLGPLNENALSETKSLGTLMYRMRYYAPATGFEISTNAAAKAHCDGSAPTGTPSVRLETPGLTIPDWNRDGKVDADTTPIDINFNGTAGNTVSDSVQPTVSASNPGKEWFVDHNDWATLNLQQTGARLDVDGLSADISTSDLGQSDLGQSDLGQSDLGQSDLGQSDLGQSDLGQSDLGQSDLGDVNYDTAISTLDATGTTTPLVATLSATVPANGYNGITLTWGPPSLGVILNYQIWRSDLNAASPTPIQVGSVSGSSTTFTDLVTDMNAADFGASANCASTMCYNTNYQYFITAVAENGQGNGTITSTPSNLVTGIVDHLFVTAFTGTATYGNTVPNFGSSAATISGLPAGGISSTGFTCIATIPPSASGVTPRNVGSYTIVCSGPAVGNPATDGVTYVNGVLMITTRAITVTAVTNTKVYDGTNSASAAPAVTSLLSPPVVAGDTANFIETYPGKKVGSGLTLTPSGSVSDGNNGNNYAVTFANNTTGVITTRPITVTAVTNTKVYDGTSSASAAPSVTSALNPPVVSGDTANFIEAYPGKNAGSGLTLTPSGSVSDGNSGNNYAVTFANNTTGVITTRPISVTAITSSKVYDGTSTANQSPAITSAYNPPIVAGDTGSFFEAYSSQNVVAGLTLVPFGSVSDGNSGNNYSVSLISVAGSISQAPLTITAVTSDKTYDGTITSTATPTTSVLAGAVTNGDSVSGLAETYDTPNAGTGKTMTVSAYVVNDGNSGNNYAVTTATNSTGEIDTAYTSDATLADFTSTLTNYATFNSAGGSDINLPYAPTASILAAGDRVEGGTGVPIVVQFPAPVSNIRVFPSIDHFGSPFDGFQYSISGSNDGVTWTPLFDALTVTGTGEPFTLGTFAGTEPNAVNNVLTDGVGPGGTVGYVADFVFSQAYTYYSFGPSTAATNSGNADQELSGVAEYPPAPAPPPHP